MDVSELLAQKARNRAERSAAPDEPELTLTAREFDYRLRKAFADREHNVEKQVRKLLDDHMREVESKIAEAIAEGKAITLKAVGEFVADVRQRLRSEIQEQCGLIRADITIAKAHGDRAGVIDLPAIPLRTQRRG